MTEMFPVDDAALVDLAVALARTPSVSGTEGPAVSLAAAAMEAAGFDDGGGRCQRQRHRGHRPRMAGGPS